MRTLSTPCQYHPGYPVFHEGLKFWSCCTKRTTEFEVFLNQVGCTTGQHVWFKEKVRSRMKAAAPCCRKYLSVFVKLTKKMLALTL